MKTKAETKEKVKRLCYYYDAYSCSEGVLRILSDIYEEPLSKDFIRIGSIFRGGSCTDTRCGIVESALAFLSYVFGRTDVNQDYERLAYWAEEIHRTFEKEFGNVQCGDICHQVNEKIENGEFIPGTHCIITEGFTAISDVIYDAYVDLKARKEQAE